jgi:hypothetical protein
MNINLTSVPESGIKSINGVRAPASNVDIISSDNSIAIVADPVTRTIDISSGGASGNTLTAVCDATVFVGAAVVSDGTKLINALADGSTSPRVLGIVVSKTNATTCVVRFSGLSEPIFSSLDITKPYFLSDILPGVLTTIPITSNGHFHVKVLDPYNSQRGIVRPEVIAIRRV